MRNSFYDKIKIGRLSVSFYYNEIIIVYIGKKHIFIKTIRRPFNRIFKKLSIAVSVLVLLIAIILWAYSVSHNVNGSSEKISDKEILNLNEAISDEEKKETLLKSSLTDFSEEKETDKVEIHVHRVMKGEVLSEIAKKYGVSMDTICGSNNLDSYDFIREGAVFRIPSKDGILFRVKKGTKLVNLAKKYRVSLEKIVKYNKLKNSDFVAVGSTIFIPDARPQNIFPGFLWPTFTRIITCGYGWRRNPFNRNYKEFHQGMDIRAKYERVRATKYGKIAFSGWLGGYGKSIIIAHPGRIKSLYAHLSRIYVRKGQYVKQGQFIGRSGNTGRSTGAHLHFEIIKNGSHRNPFIYLKRK